MGKKRIDGDGMVRRRECGRWEGRIVVGHKNNGDSIFRYFSAGTQKELMARLQKEKEIYAGIDLCEGSSMTLAEWLDQWLREFIEPTVRNTTLKSYQHYLNRFVLPRLGGRKISKITSADIQALYHWALEHGRVNKDSKLGYRLSPTTVRSLHRVLRQALEKAVEERLIPRNPTDGVTVPKGETREMQVLDDDELEKFMEAIEKDKAWYDFFYTEITTGLRQGEICGLMWKDFDGEKGTLTVRRTVHAEKGGKISAGETKTRQGHRTITLPPSTAEVLRNRKHDSKKWIFPDRLRPERPVLPQTAYQRLKKILQEAGLPAIRFHDLRHTFATHAMASGVDAKTLSNILGHSKASFTLDTYTHVTGDMQERAAEIVGGFMHEITA